MSNNKRVLVTGASSGIGKATVYKMAEQGFEVEAYYVEYGMMFAGEWHCDNDGNFSNEFISDISEGVTPDIDEAFDVTAQLQEWANEDNDDWPIDRADD